MNMRKPLTRVMEVQRAPQRPPAYAHQSQGTALALGREGFAIFAEQGTGKTRMAIDWAYTLFEQGRIGGCLVCAPKGVHRQWVESQLPLHAPGHFRGELWLGRGLPFKSKNAPQGAMLWWLANYEALHSPKGEHWLNRVLKANGQKPWALIMDESHLLKNHRTLRWKAVKTLTQQQGCVRRLAMTGTPLAKDLTDEWSQMRLVDEDAIGIRYVTHFRNEYCLMGGFDGRKVIGHRNIQRWRAKADPLSFRVRKEVLNLTARNYSDFVFDMSSLQKVMYVDMARELMADIDQGRITTAANAAVKVMRLQQISNGFAPTQEGDVVELFEKPETHNPRVRALLDIIAAEGAGDPLLVWARFRQDVRLLSRVLGEKAVTFDGSRSAKQRSEALESWSGLGGDVQVLVATPSTGGVGLNLQGACTHAIYFSNSENSIQRWQSEARIHRIGTKGIVTYTDLIAKGSRDRAILSILRAKRLLAEITLGQIRESLKEVLV